MDHRNGQFSGVECRSLNPAPSFLLLRRTLSSSPPPRRRIEGCGKKVEVKIFVLVLFLCPDAERNEKISPLKHQDKRKGVMVKP
jgi:hypothetical protein